MTACHAKVFTLTSAFEDSSVDHFVRLDFNNKKLRRLVEMNNVGELGAAWHVGA